MRKTYIAGNWKMNLDRAGARALAAAVREHVASRDEIDVGLFPAFVHLTEVAAVLESSPIRLGAQDLCDQGNGAFTGAVSAEMLCDAGVGHVLIGHSERRHVFGEQDASVHAKLARALDAGLEVVLCVGETLEERESGRTEEVVRRQLSSGLAGVEGGLSSRLTLAYEPVWAIGTGRVATPEQAQQVHSYLRGLVAGLYSESVADATRILYGGSVKPDNSAGLLGMPDIDGALVGGAALDAVAFTAIIDSGN